MLTRAELVELMGTTQTRYFHDNFKTVDHISTAVEQTGVVNADMHDFKLETGIQNGSVARFYYTNPIYNPKYSILQMKVRMSSMQDCFAFFGFCSALTPSTPPAAQSISGIWVYDGVVNFFTNNNIGHRFTPFPDIDLTNNWLFKIEYDKLHTRPLPIVYPYFDGIRVEKPTREWSLASQHANYVPENQYHYIIGLISNLTGADKVLEFKHITYSEEYAD